MKLLCKLGWHGGLAKTDTYCVGFGEKWALMECSRCGARNIWVRGHLEDASVKRLKQEYEREAQE